MKKFFVILVIVLLLPPLVNAQISLREQQDKEKPCGIGINIADNSLSIGENAGYYTSKRSQVHFGFGLTFFRNIDSDLPPIPEIGIATLSVYPLKESGMGFYGLGSISAARLEFEDFVSYGVAFGGGGGIFKRIQNQSKFGITPFAGIYLKSVYTNTTKELQSVWTGEIGLEVDISPTSSLIGSYHFFLQDAGSSFSIGLSFW